VIGRAASNNTPTNNDNLCMILHEHSPCRIEPRI
jgi:hypothetical protein